MSVSQWAAQNTGSLLAGGGIVGAFVLGMGKKLLPGIIHKVFGVKFQHLLDPADPDDQEFVKAAAKWAQKKYPQSGLGPQRYKLLSQHLFAGQPLLAEMLEAVLTDVDAEIAADLKEAVENPVKTVSPAPAAVPGVAAVPPAGGAPGAA